MMFWTKNKCPEDNPVDTSRIKGRGWSFVWNKVEFQLFSNCFSTKLIGTTLTGVKHYIFGIMTDP